VALGRTVFLRKLDALVDDDLVRHVDALAELEHAELQDAGFDRIELVERAVENTARVAAAAREAGVPVVYVRVAFRAGHPEVSPRNRAFGRLREAGAMGEDDAATAIHPALAPRAGDVVVTKKRVSAFAGSDLELVLRARDVTQLALGGISTSGVVLSTVRAAADKDYELTVLEDLCLDADEEVHRVLNGKIFPRQAEVIASEDWLPE